VNRRHPDLSGRWLARLYGCVLNVARRKIGSGAQLDIGQAERGIVGCAFIEMPDGASTRTYVMEEVLGGKKHDPGAMRTLLIRMRQTLTRMPVQR
jgi:hypothetical protein